MSSPSFDESVHPADDFFRHINGTWLDTFSLPKNRAKDGGLLTLQQNSEEVTHSLIESIAQEQPTSRIGRLFNSLMNELKIEDAAAEPFLAEIQTLLGVGNHEELTDVFAELGASGIAAAFEWYVSSDVKNPGRYALHLRQGGLSLPDQSFYTDSAHQKLRQSFVEHVRRMLDLSGAAEVLKVNAESGAQRVLALETQLALHHWDTNDLRDIEKRYNSYPASELTREFPGFDFDRWLSGLGVDSSQLEHVVVGQPSFFGSFARLWDSASVEDLKIYLVWKVLHQRAPYLHRELVTTHFDFYGSSLFCVEPPQKRWQRALKFVQETVGDDIGQEYVKTHFSPECREQAISMVDEIAATFREKIERLPWMDDPTRERALAKLSQMKARFGYPDCWHDYSELELGEDLYENVLQVARFRHRIEINHIDAEVDARLWPVTPQTVNAYYAPQTNEVIFPAGILQPPFFDIDAEDAANYGGIGAIIAHEISHAFDFQGALYEGDGRLNDWWSEETRERFTELTWGLVNQYDQYTPEGLDEAEYRVNGRQTLGENIGDVSGLEIALATLERVLVQQGLTLESAPKVDGLTALQQFFVAWAQSWRTSSTIEHTQAMLETSGHAPDEFRVNGAVRNVDAFYEAFDVRQENALYLPPEERVHIFSVDS